MLYTDKDGIIRRARPTRYAGVLFRSRLESRWARFFDAEGLAWSYEPCRFVLSNGGVYTPDFWLRGLQSYVEIKPEWPGPIEEFRYVLAVEWPRLPLYLVVGTPERSEARLFWLNGDQVWPELVAFP